MSGLSPQRLDASALGFDQALGQLLAGNADAEADVTQVVADIIRRVRREGDAAVLDYTRQFDQREVRDLAALRIEPDALEQALAEIEQPQRRALEHAAQRIRNYHEHQKQSSWQYEDEDGTVLGQRVTPLSRVGIYVPGGKASYPSSVLMNAIPAGVAGVEDILMVVPAPKGEINPLVLAAAALAGVSEVYTIGGAQAIAALAYGTESIAPVDKIVGPGNAYVAAAKRAVFGQVGLDMVAGPSEILVVCDGLTPPDWIAMDLFSQAEHDEQAQSILISDNAAFLDSVLASMERLLPEMSRRPIIECSINERGALIQVDDLEQAAEIASRIAPEHLELSVAEPEALLPLIRHAGAIFLGRHTPEALGDYCAGPNHVLPTSTTSRFSSPLGVYDFQKRSSLIACSAKGAAGLAETASVLARSESLEAHARSAEFRR